MACFLRFLDFIYISNQVFAFHFRGFSLQMMEGLIDGENAAIQKQYFPVEDLKW